MTEFERIRQKYQGEAQKRSNSIALAKARIQGLEAQVKALNAEREEVRGWDISSERAQKWNELTDRINAVKSRIDEVRGQLFDAELGEQGKAEFDRMIDRMVK